MTYHARLLLSVVPGAITIALVVYLTLWVFEVLDTIAPVLQQGS